MSIWTVPTELPDLRRVDVVAIDTETNDEGCAPIAVRAGRGTAAGSAAYPSPGAKAVRSARSIFRCDTPTARTSTPPQSPAGSRTTSQPACASSP